MWLIDPAYLNQFSGVQLTDNVITAFDARSNASLNYRDIYSVEGDTATIHIQGPMLDRPSFFAMLFGGAVTTYGMIIDAITAAEKDSDVNLIRLQIDSPGGTAAGMFDAAEKVRNASKPTEAIGVNQVASAAYGLASQAGKFYVKNAATRVGSVGVVVDAYVSKGAVSVTSTNAPLKRHDLATEEGRDNLRAELDDIADLFAETIAEGRGVSVEKVNADFGRGGMLVASKALRAGMIDGVISGKQTTATHEAEIPEGDTMDLAKLKAEHRDVYAAAVAEGVAQERERVSAHLTLGEAYNAMDTALEAVQNGADMTMSLQAKYLAAAANKANIDQRQQESASTQTDADSQTTQTANTDAAIDEIFSIASHGVSADLEG